MTDYNVTVGKELLPGLLSGQDGLAKLIENILNQILEAQVSESLSAERYERVVSRAALIISGMREDGHREVLGIKIGDTESFLTWDETFRWLKGRGECG